MRRLIVSLFVAVGIVGVARADDGAKWMTDYKKALTLSAKTGKPILADFTGSDWCGWCKKLDGEVFSQKAFKKFASENLILLLVDFPSRRKAQSKELKQQNQKLQRKYGVHGYPTILILNSKGKVIAKTGYRDGGPETYVQHLKELLKRNK